MPKTKIILNTNIKHFPIIQEWEKKFNELGYEYRGAVCFTEEDLIKYGKDAEIIEEVLHSPITWKVLKSLPGLKIVVKHGTGYENVDINAAQELGIKVYNTADFCTDIVSSHCIMLLLAISRNLTYWHNWTREKNWKPGAPPYGGLNIIRDEKVGILGFGHIGKDIYRKLYPFGPQILIYDPYVKLEESQFKVKNTSFEDLLKESKYIIIACAQTKDNIHMMDQPQFDLMGKDSIIINISRGGLINEEAMIKSLQKNKIGGAALDVFEEEPISPENPLLKMNNVIITPHQAGMSPLTAKRLLEIVYNQLVSLMSGKEATCRIC